MCTRSLERYASIMDESAVQLRQHLLKASDEGEPGAATSQQQQSLPARELRRARATALLHSMQHAWCWSCRHPGQHVLLPR